MSITTTQEKDLNRMNVVARKVQLGTLLKNVEARVAANQADSTASDVAGLVTDFNALLAALQEAGLMEAGS